MSAVMIEPTKGQLLDELEVALAQLPRVELPVTHRFTKGMYIREIQIPAGTMLTSMTHKTEHPFVISEGAIKVTSDNEGSVIYEAPHTGITKPNTRRALHALTDVVWTTFHVTDETDVEKICEQILEPQDNKHILEATGEDLACGYTHSLPNKD
jgi:hypothetical protein